MITDEQIKAAWDATKRDDQPVYDELPFATKAILRRRADHLAEFGLSHDEWWQAFEQRLLAESEAGSEPVNGLDAPLPVEVVEELIVEAQSEPELEPPTAPEPVEERPPPEKPKPKPAVKKTAKKLAEKKEEKKVARKPVLVKKATKKAVKK